MSEGFKEYTIYKIECKDPEVKHIYVGSTEDYESRVNRHKRASEDLRYGEFGVKTYKKIREYGGFDNWNIEILEKVVCRKADARKLEEEYRVKLKADLNTNRCYIDHDVECDEELKKEYTANKIKKKLEEFKQKSRKFKEETNWENVFPTENETAEERAEYLKEKKKVYKIREKERKMAELREKAKEYGDLSKFDKFPKP